MKNSLQLKNRALLKTLKVGQAVLIGPYKHPKTAANSISNSNTNFKFTQKQMILVDSDSLVAYKMYLITRTE